MQTRRGLITGLISLVAAPAIIRVNHLMPIYTHKEVAVPIVFDIESFPPGHYHAHLFQVVMKDGVIITDYQIMEDTRKYIRSISHFT